MSRINPENVSLHAISILGEARDFSNNRKGRECSSGQTGVFRFLFFLLFTFFVPTTLIWLEIIPFKYRFYVFFFILMGFLFYCFLRRYSFYELGFRTDNLSNSLHWNLLFCAVGAVCLYTTCKAGLLRPRNVTYLPFAYAAYIFLLGPVQEVVFRGILFAEMKRMRVLDSRWIVVLSTLPFCFLHVIYRQPSLLLITFVSGMVWGVIFRRWPNIWGISLSHSLLGSLAMFLGVI
jgi:uncharacterized protein